MPEAVIVAATRSPIGRAFKGSLKDLRPDDLAATFIRAALDQPAPRALRRHANGSPKLDDMNRST